MADTGPAAELRTAARLMRERAEAATLFPATSGENRGKHYCLDCTPSIDDQTIYATWPCPRYAAITTELLRGNSD